jgi:hypothetical protein
MSVFSKRFLRQLMLGCLIGSGVWAAAMAGADVKVTSTDKVVFPSGLSWERMRIVPLDHHPATPGTPLVKPSQEDIDAARRIWADEISKGLAKDKSEHFQVLVGSGALNGHPVTVSLIDLMDFERCEPPANGKSVVDVYSKCLARVAIGPLKAAHTVEFQGFCFVFSPWMTPEEIKFREHTHNDVAFDAKTGVIYFRTIQQGKNVAACQRAVRIAQ